MSKRKRYPHIYWFEENRRHGGWDVIVQKVGRDSGEKIGPPQWVAAYGTKAAAETLANILTLFAPYEL